MENGLKIEHKSTNMHLKDKRIRKANSVTCAGEWFL